LMKSGKSLDQVIQDIKEKELLESSWMVERCGMEGELVVYDLDSLEAQTGYFSTILVKDRGKKR